MKNQIDAARHPIQVIELIARDHRCTFEFSLYAYTPRAIDDERQVIKVRSSEVQAWFADVLTRLPEDQDVAFHSRVYDDTGAIFHLPMIDFKDFEPERDGRALEEALADFGIESYRLFQSGRSFHLYGIHLFQQDRWLAFLGRILLLNLPGKPEIVDVRWVGHRLMGGYGTLRWTKNNLHYKAMPTLWVKGSRS